MNPTTNPAQPAMAARVPSWRRWLLIVLGVLSPLYCFGLLAEGIRNRGGWGWDTSALVLLHKHDSPGMDAILTLVAQSGDIRIVVIFTVLCAIALLILQRKREERFLARCVVGAAVIVFVVKEAFRRARSQPWELLGPQIDLGSPSAHSMATLTLALGLVVIAWRTRWRWMMIVLGTTYAVSVALSQVYLGIHQASDVLSAWGLALPWVIAMGLLRGRTWADLTHKWIPLTFGLLAGFVAIFAGYLSSDLAHDNLRVVAPGQVYRARQMSTDALARCIRTYGIKSILNLRGRNEADRWYQGETQTAEKLHVAHYDFGISAAQELGVPDLDRMVQLLRDAPKPVLLHCEGGADRSGLASALYLYRMAGKPPAEAAGELSLWNGHLPLLRPWVRAMDHSFWRYVSNRVGHAQAALQPGN